VTLHAARTNKGVTREPRWKHPGAQQCLRISVGVVSWTIGTDLSDYAPAGDEGKGKGLVTTWLGRDFMGLGSRGTDCGC